MTGRGLVTSPCLVDAEDIQHPRVTRVVVSVLPLRRGLHSLSMTTIKRLIYDCAKSVGIVQLFFWARS